MTQQALVVYFIRHGRTPYVQERRLQGHHDPPLDEFGRRQAEAAAHALSKLGIRALWASDLTRTMQTAEIISRAIGIPVTTTPLLREARFGSLEGMLIPEIHRMEADNLNHADSIPLELAAKYGGETMDAMQERVLKGIGLAEASAGGGPLAIVSHGGVIRLSMTHFLGMPPFRYWQLRVEPGSLNEVWRTPTATIVARLNDTSHLAALSLESPTAVASR